MKSESFPVCRFMAPLLSVALVFALASCVVVPTSTEGGFDKKKELINSLNGADITDVRLQLGPPTNSFELPDVTYLFYLKHGQQQWISLAHPIAVIWHQLPVQQGSATLAQCLLIESRDEKVVHAEIRSRSNSLDRALRVPGRYNPIGCPSLFWNDEELQRIEASARKYRPELLTTRANQGDIDAAISLANEFAELRFLREFAVAGDLDAATALARSFSEKKPLYDLAKQGNLNAAIRVARLFDDQGPLKTLVDSGNRDAETALQNFLRCQIHHQADRTVNSQAAEKIVNVCGDDNFSL